MTSIIRTSAILIVFGISLGSIRAGEGTTKYPFAQNAAKSIDQLKDLAKLSGKNVSLAGDEATLLAKKDAFSFGDVALIASGAVEAQLRQKYGKQLDAIEAETRKALAGVESVTEKGKKLLKVLHDGPMAKGYASTQTDLTGILDSGKFNCVSSAVLYNVIARRVGLEVKAYEIPGGSFGTGHVFSVLCEGNKEIPVETTNANGFNVNENMKKKNKRELSDLGLVAVIYYNHGVELSKKKHYHEALAANLKALGLDSSNTSAANNVMADLTNWGVNLTKEEKHAEALEVIRVALTLAPKDAKLLQNRKAVIQQIVNKEIKAGQFAAALHRIDEHKALLGDKELARRMAINVFDTHAKQFRDKKDWEKVVEIYVEALKSYPKDGHLTNNLIATYDAWAQLQMRESNFAAAISIYEQGLKQLPGTGLFRNNIRYCQEQMKQR